MAMGMPFRTRTKRLLKFNQLIISSFFIAPLQIFVTVCLACAVAQQQQQQYQPQQQQRNQQQQYQQPQQEQQAQQAQQYQSPQQQARYEDQRISSTTWIPILSYNKEQGQDGSYRAA